MRQILLLLAASISLAAHAQDLVVMSSGGFAGAYETLAPNFETQTSTHLTSVWGPSMGSTPGAIPVRLAHGESADVVILARGALDELVKQGLVVSGSQVDLVRSRIGMAVRAGAPVPDISTVDKFRQVLLGAKSVAYSDSASGVYIAGELFKKLGIEGQLAPKSHQIPATPVGEVVARGEAEIGFQQLSELKPIAGITVVGPIPDELQKVTIFGAGIVAASKHQEQARRLIQYLAQPSSCDAISANALDPIACTTTAKDKSTRPKQETK